METQSTKGAWVFEWIRNMGNGYLGIVRGGMGMGAGQWAECVRSSVMREMTTLNRVLGRERKRKVR